MAEQLGGSRGRNDDMGGSKRLGTPGGLSGTMGGSRRAGGMAGMMKPSANSPVMGGGGYKPLSPGQPSARPLSAPPRNFGMTGTVPRDNSPAAVRARVEEIRQLKEAQFWGRMAPPKRDLPAYWSLSAHGQPYNDERLGQGVVNQWQLEKPKPLNSKAATPVGPATEMYATMRMSLETGSVRFKRDDLSPLNPAEMATLSKGAQVLTPADREFLISKMPVAQRMHALRNCLDWDRNDSAFMPWTESWDPAANAGLWKSGVNGREICIRLALSKVETMMRQHLQYISEQECRSARAPAAQTKHVLHRAFWKVDPDKTGHVSIQQFLQVWQNVLQLWEFDVRKEKGSDGRLRDVLKPTKRKHVDRGTAAALFVKYGFDKDGLLPYVVYIQALTETPARLLGHELILNKAADEGQGKNGLEDEVDVAYCVGNAKIIYPNCRKGVFPPTGFDPRIAFRSRTVPRAHMQLEHVYGYNGHAATASNIFYTHNTQDLPGQSLSASEIVYYVGAVGVVFNKKAWNDNLELAKSRAGGGQAAGAVVEIKPAQRFFFGHDNDIMCMAIHPNRQWVATGQQIKAAEAWEEGVDKRPPVGPYVCIWDVDTCSQLQRLEHSPSERCIVAVCFSGNPNVDPARYMPKSPDAQAQAQAKAQYEAKLGGDICVTVTGDNAHTIHVWRWMTNPNKYYKQRYIPGWYMGPHKKLPGLGVQEPEPYFYNPLSHADAKKEKEAMKPKVDALLSEKDPSKMHPVLGPMLMAPGLRPSDALGLHDRHEPEFRHMCDQDLRATDHTAQLLAELPGCNGQPPMVYGVVWNPLRPHDASRGSEFVSYGVKHLRSWILDDDNVWKGTAATFGPDKVSDVLSACFVPALHHMAAPGDSCLLTGFENGQIGLWLPPYPTRAGAQYTLISVFDAHKHGPKVTLNNGAQVGYGVRAIRLKPDGRTIITGGADGRVIEWKLEAPQGVRKDGTPRKGVVLKLSQLRDAQGRNVPAGMFDLKEEAAPLEDYAEQQIVALDCHRNLPDEFVAGTRQNDIWEVDSDPRIMVEGHEDTVMTVAVHPADPYTFATACESGVVRIFDVRVLAPIVKAAIGFTAAGIAFSQEPYTAGSVPGWTPTGRDGRPKADGYHLAVSSAKGRIAILSADTLQPLVHIHDSKEAVDELKYSPTGGTGILAAASHDLHIYLYRVGRKYELLARCTGHSGTVEHIDWSLPLPGPDKYRGRMILQSVDASRELLYWNPETGKQITKDQRDTYWATQTCQLGFTVMGIWPDYSDGTDVNDVDKSKLGNAVYDPVKAAQLRDAGRREDCFQALTLPEDGFNSADGVRGAGYLVTADDFATVKLFNYPTVWDDAPFKAFRGHASHVSCIRFLLDDRRVVSVGGIDRSVMQWRTTGINRDDLEKDKVVLQAMQEAVVKRAKEALTEVPPEIAPTWGPMLGPDGKPKLGPDGLPVKYGQQISPQQLQASMSSVADPYMKSKLESSLRKSQTMTSQTMAPTPTRNS